MFDYTPKLYDIPRYSRNVEVKTENGRRKYQPLIGEEAGLLTVFTAFAMARRPTIVDAFSGTGKTVMADAVVSLLPESDVETTDMLSAKAIYAKAAQINRKRFMYAPELQNAGDQDEFVKVLKKLGEGKSAKREVTGGLLQDGTRDLVSSEINWIPTLTTRAVENKKADEIFNEEAQRRFVIVATDPSANQTRKVINAQAKVYARGVKRVRDMNDFEMFQLRAHVAASVNAYERIDDVLIPGIEAFAARVPDVFTSSRSAFPTLVAVAKGVGIFYHTSETIVESVEDEKTRRTLVLSPERFAETLEFYGPTFYANCMRLPAMGQALIERMPAYKTNRDGVVDFSSMLTVEQIGAALSATGWSIEKKKVEAMVARLVDVGFIARAEIDDGAKRYHLTPLSDIKNTTDWAAILENARDTARDVLGDQAEAWVKKHAQGRSVTYTSPITGETVTTGAI